MYIIAGLGNPTKTYEGTRHNVGFRVIDKIAQDYHISVDIKKHKALCGKGVIEGQKVILAKPQTFMNLSGESIRAMADYYKVDPQDILIIFDDVSLDVGQLRIRKKAVQAGIMVLKVLLRIWEPMSFRESKSASGKSRKAGIWQTMFWENSAGKMPDGLMRRLPMPAAQ